MMRVTMLSLAAACAWALVACGGATPDPKAPAAAKSDDTATKNEAPAKHDDAPVVDAGAAQKPVGAAPPPPVAPAVAAADSRPDLDPAAKPSYDKALRALGSADLAAARLSLQEAIDKAPKSATAHHALGAVLERAGDVRGAEAQYNSALSANPGYEPAIGALAMLLARDKRVSEADTLVSEKQRRFPTSVAVMTTLAEVKSIEEDHATAQRLAQEALKLRPTYVPAMIAIARDYFRTHRYDVARYALGVVIDGDADNSIPAADKNNAEAHLLRGLIERQVGERRAAMDDFAAAASAAGAGDPVEALVNVGEMRLEAGNAQEAKDPLEKALHLAPSVAVIHLDVGDCYRLLGRAGDAKRELEAALSMDSSLVAAHYDLGLLYLFSPQVPGVSSPEDQVATALKELGTFKSSQSVKARPGEDDVDGLISAAKKKQIELQAKKLSESAPASAPKAPAGAPAPGDAPPSGAKPEASPPAHK